MEKCISLSDTNMKFQQSEQVKIKLSCLFSVKASQRDYLGIFGDFCMVYIFNIMCIYRIVYFDSYCAILVSWLPWASSRNAILCNHGQDKHKSEIREEIIEV